MIRVLIADDQALIRVAFRMIVGEQPAMEVAGEAPDGVAAVTLAQRLRPDVVLMDIRMPQLDGIQATQRIADVLPEVRVLALSTFDLDEHVVAALRAGASGFLPLDVSPEELTEAIRIVHRGDSAVAPRLLTCLIGTFIRTSRPRPAVVPPTLAGLSARELDILVLIAWSLSNADIAGRLAIAESTVKNHVTSLFGKLRVRDRAQAVIAAYEAGLVTPGRTPALARRTRSQLLRPPAEVVPRGDAQPRPATLPSASWPLRSPRQTHPSPRCRTASVHLTRSVALRLSVS